MIYVYNFTILIYRKSWCPWHRLKFFFSAGQKELAPQCMYKKLPFEGSQGAKVIVFCAQSLLASEASRVRKFDLAPKNTFASVINNIFIILQKASFLETNNQLYNRRKKNIFVLRFWRIHIILVSVIFLVILLKSCNVFV